MLSTTGSTSVATLKLSRIMTVSVRLENAGAGQRKSKEKQKTGTILRTNMKHGLLVLTVRIKGGLFSCFISIPPSINPGASSKIISQTDYGDTIFHYDRLSGEINPTPQKCYFNIPNKNKKRP
jgi:hypothetical protein